MLGRLWRNYWAGLWLLLGGLGVAVAGTAVAILVYRLTDLEATWPYRAAVDGWWLGGAIAAVGFVVWAYRFHTEDRRIGSRAGNGR